MPTTNTMQKAQGACDSKGMHTNTNSEDSRSHGPIQQAPDGKATSAANTPAITAQQDLTLTITTTEPRVDHRLLAQVFGNKPRHTLRLIEQYLDRFQKLGKVCFKNAPLPGSKTGQSERFALLNEDQAHLLLSLSRNSDTVVDLKLKLVQAFGSARRAADMRQTEYLPSYHHLQDSIHAKSATASNAGRIHMNIAKLVNKTVGLETGQRAAAPVLQQAMLIVAQTVAARAMQSAHDHHDGYQRVKQSLLALTAVTMLEAVHE